MVGRTFPRFTPSTICSRDQIHAAARQIRERGFALDLEENEAGVRCIAASIAEPLQGLVAALSLSAPSVRLTKDLLPSRVREVTATARQIKAALHGAPKGIHVAGRRPGAAAKRS